MFEFWNTIAVVTDREKQFVMPALLSLLAPGCQTQPGLTEVTRLQPQQPSSERWPDSSPSPTEGFPLREAESRLSRSRLHSNELRGTANRVSPDSRVLTVSSAVIESRYGPTVTRRVRPLKKLKEIRLVDRMSLGRCWRLSATQALVYQESHLRPYACARLCLHTGVLFYSVDRQHFLSFSHTQISTWLKAASLPHFCVKSGIFMNSLKCLSSRLYCDLHIWYHLKILTIN